MIAAHNVHLRFGERKLFEDVNITFNPGNCYGLIGANGAGKSTFMKVLSGEVSPTSGSVSLQPGQRLSFLRQDHHAYNDYSVIETVMMGNEKLYHLMKEKDEIYSKDPFSEADGIRASEIEAEFAELGGWEAEADAGSLISGLGLGTKILDQKMEELSGSEKVKVLLAQALFGSPHILLLDEPTNDLDIKAINWLENFLLEFKNTAIVISHDRHFLNKVCTHMADIDFGRITVYSGNYNFWREASELNAKLRSDQRKKAEDKAKELKTFIARFSANAAKSKQATSRRKILDSLDLSSLPISSRKYPYIHFEQEREAGRDLLRVEGVNVSKHGQKALSDVSFTVDKGEKVLVYGSDLTQSTLLALLAQEQSSESGEVHWGVTTSKAYFPSDHTHYFSQYVEDNLLEWLRRFAKNEEQQDETFLRGFLGRMLFSGESVYKKIGVLSGGEKVRCLLARMMLAQANVLIFDQPTGHLDLESITALNEGLTAFSGTIFFSSTDHEFIQTVANRLLVFNDQGQVIFDKKTDFDSYLALEASA